MTHINDPEPIIFNGKVLYENELDRIKKMYGFMPPNAINSDLDPEERAKRALTKAKYRINKAR